MRQSLLRSLSPLFLILIACAGIVLLTTLFSTSALQFLKPDLVTILVLYVALRRSFFEGCLLSLAFGYLQELHSTLPNGAGLTTAIGVFLSLHILLRYLLISIYRPPLWIFPLTTIFAKAMMFGTLYALSFNTFNWKQAVIWLGPDLLINSIAGLWLYRFLGKVDWHTFKDERAIQVFEGERVLEEEGI